MTPQRSFPPRHDPELRPRLAVVHDPSMSTVGARLLIAAGEAVAGLEKHVPITVFEIDRAGLVPRDEH